MTMNGVAQGESWDYKQMFKSVVKLLIGGGLGATVYLLTAKTILDQTHLSCDLEFSRFLVEASRLPAEILLDSIMSPESSFYRPVRSLIAGMPYAVLGSLVVLGVRKRILLVMVLLTGLYLCLSLFAVAFMVAATCA
jgi:hypothetical protein